MYTLALVANGGIILFIAYIFLFDRKQLATGQPMGPESGENGHARNAGFVVPFCLLYVFKANGRRECCLIDSFLGVSPVVLH